MKRAIATAVTISLTLAAVAISATPATADETHPAPIINSVDQASEPTTTDTQSTDFDTPEPSTTPTPDPASTEDASAPIPQPSGDAVSGESDTPTSTPAPTPTPAPAPVTAAPIQQAAVTAVRPGPDDTGYTYCWVTHPELTDLDPYDARTWGVVGMCAPNEDHRTPWTASVRAWNTTTDQLITSGFADPNAGGGTSEWSASGDAARWGANGANSPEDANLAVEPGQTIRVMYDLALQMPTPDTKPIIGVDGNPGTRSIPQINFRMPMKDGAYQDAIPSNWDGVRVSASDQSCNAPSLNSVAGQKLLVWCTVDVTIDPTYTLDEWIKVRGRALALQPDFTYELQWVYDGAPGPWNSRTLTMPTYSRIDAAQTWLPTAKDKTFRVKAADTLTVTPSGLLVGAEWNQGNVSELNTYITDVPEGGKLTSDGNLEFTSEQVGNYDFKYYLEDPASGIRSRDASGDIEVYDSPTVVPPPTPAPENPIAIAPKPVPAALPATVLAHTGSSVNASGAGLLGVVLTVVGLALIFIRRRRTTRGSH